MRFSPSFFFCRAELEHAFGQQLESLAGDATASDKTGVTGSIAAVHQELAKAAQSHVDFSKRLQSNVAEDLKRWIQDHKAGLQKVWSAIVKMVTNAFCS